MNWMEALRKIATLSTRQAKRPTQARPGLERLEARWCPSVLSTTDQNVVVPGQTFVLTVDHTVVPDDETQDTDLTAVIVWGDGWVSDPDSVEKDGDTFQI